MQNCAVRLCYDLRKYDHVSEFYHRLQWLPLPYFIQFKSLCLMYHHYHQVKCIPLEPPIVFGATTSYSTRTPVYFANIPFMLYSTFLNQARAHSQPLASCGHTWFTEIVFVKRVCVCVVCVGVCCVCVGVCCVCLCLPTYVCLSICTHVSKNVKKQPACKN